MTEYRFASDPHGRENTWIKCIEHMRHTKLLKPPLFKNIINDSSDC